MLPRPSTCLHFSPADYAQISATLKAKNSIQPADQQQQQQPSLQSVQSLQRTPLQNKK